MFDNYFCFLLPKTCFGKKKKFNVFPKLKTHLVSLLKQEWEFLVTF